MFQALVLAATFGLLLTTVGWTWNTWQFWSFLGLFWCSQQLGRMQGRVEGIITFMDLPEQEQQRLKQVLKTAREDIK